MLFRALSPGGESGRLTILIFHRVRERPDPLFPHDVSAESFTERLHWIRTWFNVLPLEEGIRALAGGHLCERSLAITFDDGYADNATIALPILLELGLHATFFITSGFVDGGSMWNDTVIEAVRAARRPRVDLTAVGLGVHELETIEQKRAVIQKLIGALKYRPDEQRVVDAGRIAASCGAQRPPDLMMTMTQVRALAATGMGIGGHTVNHPILARLGDERARLEIAHGREQLEAMIRQPVRLFAYPNGKPDVDYHAGNVSLVKSLGFSAAVTTSSGVARAGDGLHELPRFTPWDPTQFRWGMRLAINMRTRARTATA